MTQHHQNRKYADCSAGSQRVIAEVLSDIENNLAEPFRACEGLESRRMSIKEAAEYVGIYDLNCFSRLFKKYTGQTPGEYRENIMLNARPAAEKEAEQL